MMAHMTCTPRSQSKSANETPEQIPSGSRDYYRCDRLILDHVAEAGNLLLRPTGGLVV
jgi:hypothetical protein